MTSRHKKDQSKIRSINQIDMLLLVDKDFRDGIFHDIHRYMEANNK